MRNSSYRIIFRDLLAGVKQELENSELAFELPAEIK